MTRQQHVNDGTRQHRAGALSAMRPSLEHQPRRDPFAVDVAAALEELSATWGGIYCIAHVNKRWRAARIDGTGCVLTGISPDDLAVQMRACWRPW